MGRVYALRRGKQSIFKIGRTGNETVEPRRKASKTWNPRAPTKVDEIETEHEVQCEGYLHKVLLSRKISGEWYALSLDELHAVFNDARAFVAEFALLQPQVEALKRLQCDDRRKKPSNEDVALYRQIVELRQRRYKMSFELQHLEWQLQISIGMAAGIEGVATWKTQSRTMLDQYALKMEYPDIYKRFLTKTIQSRRFDLVFDANDDACDDPNGQGA